DAHRVARFHHSRTANGFQNAMLECGEHERAIGAGNAGAKVYRSSEAGNGREGGATRALRHDLLRTARDLLSEKIAAVADAAIEGNRGEMRAALALVIGPRRETRSREGRDVFDGAQKTVVKADGANIGLVISTFGAKTDELNQPREVVGANVGRFDATDLAHTVGK